MSLVIYQYPNCSTCRRALAWLDERNASYEKVDIVTKPPTVATLARAMRLADVPVRKLFNTSGESYRAGNWKERLVGMPDGDALTALAADGKLIKRPLVIGNDFARVGFDAKAWAEVIGS